MDSVAFFSTLSMDALKRAQIIVYGWYIHYVPNDTLTPNGTNIHTHGLPMSCKHKDLQICLPISLTAAQEILWKLIKKIKEGTVFETDIFYKDILPDYYTVQFINAIESGRDVLRLILPDQNNGYGQSDYKAQFTMTDNQTPS